MNDKRTRWLVPSLAGVLYFSEGLPYGVVNELMPLYLRTEKISLAEIGMLSTVSLAWMFKVAWSPLVDLYGSYRRWIAGALLVITVALAALAVVHPTQRPMFWALVTILTIASATQDIAADALIIRVTPQTLLGPVNSIRVAAYRGAVIVAGGALAAFTAIAGWRGAFLAAAGMSAAILVFTILLPTTSGDQARHANPFRGLWSWLRRPRAVWLLAIILLYKLGDFALAPMIKPYWVDRGYSAAEIGTVTTVIGVSFLIAGAIVGGLLVARSGIWMALLVFGILQILSNVGYALAASFEGGRVALYAVSTIESFTFGLATSGFLAYLMAICDRSHAATQYAMLSAVFVLTRSVIGTFSGFAAERMGYAPYFWLTVFLGIPVLFLLPKIRQELVEARAAVDAGAVLEG